MNKLKEKEKNYLAFYTISHRKMILWMKSRNLKKETKKTNIKWTKRYKKEKTIHRLIVWTFSWNSHDSEKKATQKTEIFEKKKVAVRFSLITFCAYVDYFIVCYKVEKH